MSYALALLIFAVVRLISSFDGVAGKSQTQSNNNNDTDSNDTTIQEAYTPRREFMIRIFWAKTLQRGL